MQGMGGPTPLWKAMGQPDDETKPVSKMPSRGDAKGTLPNTAFDMWLRRGLHSIFDDVAREPIPPELLRLIEQDRKK